MKPLIIILILCSVSNARADSGNVKFFVMGHIHAWFQTHVAPVIDENREDLDFLVFTGDVVMNSTAENWESVYSIIHKLEIETYIAPGNHDLTFKNPETKETTYAYETFQTYSGTSYGSFRKGKNLFKNQGDMQIWISDDAKKLPVKIRIKMKFGSMTLLLKKIS